MGRLQALSIAIVVSLAPPCARAEASNWCFWMILHDAHAIATRCSGPLAPEIEGRYEQLRRATETALLRDASLHAGATAESLKAQMAQYAARTDAALDPALCEKPDAKAAVKIFETLTSSENLTHFEAALAKPRDPFDGDCI